MLKKKVPVFLLCLSCVLSGCSLFGGGEKDEPAPSAEQKEEQKEPETKESEDPQKSQTAQAKTSQDTATENTFNLREAWLKQPGESIRIADVIYTLEDAPVPEETADEGMAKSCLLTIRMENRGRDDIDLSDVPEDLKKGIEETGMTLRKKEDRDVRLKSGDSYLLDLVLSMPEDHGSFIWMLGKEDESSEDDKGWYIEMPGSKAESYLKDGDYVDKGNARLTVKRHEFTDMLSNQDEYQMTPNGWCILQVQLDSTNNKKVSFEDFDRGTIQEYVMLNEKKEITETMPKPAYPDDPVIFQIAFPITEHTMPPFIWTIQASSEKEVSYLFA